MAQTEKYFIGPTLLGEIRQVITRVSGTPDRTRGVRPDGVFQDMPRPGPGGGGGGMKLGKVTSAWNKNSLRDVMVYDQGAALNESTSSPPLVLEGVVNVFADVDANSWVMVGKANGRWYLIAAEC